MIRIRRVFFDTEFFEDGQHIELISIGMVKENGEMYYAENAEFDWSLATPWLHQNVKPHLCGPTKKRSTIRREVLDFAGKNPEFWAYFSDYDWVVLCQLFGSMVELPKHWPMFCLDLQQQLYLAGNPIPPSQPAQEHHALADAQWVMETWRWLCARPNRGRKRTSRNTSPRSGLGGSSPPRSDSDHQASPTSSAATTGDSSASK